MEQILIVGDDTDVNVADERQKRQEVNTDSKSSFDSKYVKEIMDYLCKLYGIDRIDIDSIINSSLDNSIAARYVITAITTLRNSSNIKEAFKAPENNMADSLANAVMNVYADNDELNQKINDASNKVEKLKDTNDDIKQMFEKEIKAAFEREKAANKSLIEQYKISLEAKDKTYTLIMRNNNDLKKENKELKEKADELKLKNDELKAMLALHNNKDNDAGSVRAGETNPFCINFFDYFSRKNSKKAANNMLDTFINDILSNDHFSKVQKDYLMDCIESDMSYEEIKRIAKPEIDVEMMKRLVRYYNKENKK
jgi:hypothetical protein